MFNLQDGILQDSELVIVAIVIGLLVAVATELVKHFTNDGLTVPQIQLLNLTLGWVGGMVAMYFFSGNFLAYSVLGLAGGVWAPGIYDVIIKGLGLDVGKDAPIDESTK